MVTFYYTAASPAQNIKQYGTSQTLNLTVTVSGTEENYTYDSSFYLGNDVQVGSTTSGITSGQATDVSLSTLSGTSYSWYVEATSSGVTDTSPTYNFYVRYLCSGICNEDGEVASGINVRAHRRVTGELVGQTTTAGDGVFSIDSTFNEQHYVVALNPDEGFNALIYDHVEP